MVLRALVSLVCRLVPGPSGAFVADEILTAYAADRRLLGQRRAAWRACREVFAPSLWVLRRELLTTSRTFVPPTRVRPGDIVLQSVLSDFRFAIRSLWKRPGFTAIAVLIVAVGIGASTTIFTVVDHVLLRQLPYDRPAELVHFNDPSFAVPYYSAWKLGTSAFDGFAAAASSTMDLASEGEPRRIPVASVTPEFFTVLRVTPALGRTFAESEYNPEPDAAILSHGAWRRLFGGDEDIIGRSFVLDERPRRVVGVLGPDFEPPQATVGRQVDVWMPFDASAADRREAWGVWYLSILARLAPGVRIDSAQEQLDVLSERLAEADPEHFVVDGEVYTVDISPLLVATVGDVRPTLYLLLGAVAMMLLIACANVASLLLARATTRHREIAVRSALGASRAHLIQQLLSEALVLSLAGAAVGVGVAIGGVALFNRFQPGDIPRATAVHVDLRILAFALFAAIGTGVLFGLAPAWRAARADVNLAIRDGGGAVSNSPARQRLRGGLVVIEVALAVVLTVGAGLLFNSFLRLSSIDPGFDTEELLSVQLGLATYTSAERLPFVESTLTALRAVPGVEAVGLGITVPFSRTGTSRCCWFDSAAAEPDRQEPILTILNPVDDGYFGALAATILHGRAIEAADGADDPVVVINESAAHNLFGRGDVVGEIVYLDDLELRIVGVVVDIKHWGLGEDAENQFYVPYRGFHAFFRHVDFLIRGQRADLVGAIRGAIWSVDPRLPVEEVATMRQMVADSVATPRFYSGLFLLFSLVALVLAAGGLYGALTFQVGARRRELAIRVALGARAAEVIRMVVRDGLTLTVLGLLVGFGVALGLGRLLDSLVFGIGTADPGTYAVVGGTLLLVALAACYLPALRAGRSDPLVSLRTE